MKANNTPQQNQGCLQALLSLVGIKPRTPKSANLTVQYLPADPDPLPYRLRDDFLSPAEKSFYLVLKGMLGNALSICPKVSLADLFFVTRPNENKSAHNRISRKHVDFVICDPRTMRPLFAIELDDSSHDRPDRVDRGAFVDSVFEAAQLRLLHIPVQASYNTTDLGTLFKSVLPKPNAVPTQSPETKIEPPKGDHMAIGKEGTAPFCPKCGTQMTLRTANRGATAGKQFYGCVNYPNCRVVIPLDEVVASKS